MAKKFTLKIAGAEWIDYGHSVVLRVGSIPHIAFVSKSKSSYSCGFSYLDIPWRDGFKTLSAAKAYVIKSLATAEKSRVKK